MFQDFTPPALPKDTRPRLVKLRGAMAKAGLDGFFIPRADAFQNETPTAHDARLEWITGFSGSAGQCLVLAKQAAIISDGRYRLQLRKQVNSADFTLLESPAQTLTHWAGEVLGADTKLGFDSWLYSAGQVEAMRQVLDTFAIKLIPCDNLIDAIWHDQPPRPNTPIGVYPQKYAGVTHADKRADIAATLRKDGHKSTLITKVDNLAWLLNTRGADLAHTPINLSFGILYDDGQVDLFIDSMVSDAVRGHLGESVRIKPMDDFIPVVAGLSGTVRVDKGSVPCALIDAMGDAGVDFAFARDPIALPKACKNPVEIKNSQAAHIVDGVAMCEFLCWLDSHGTDPQISEIDVVRALESYRGKADTLRGISFDTIAGTGANGAIIHYRVTEKTNRQIQNGDVLLVDSGGQYINGTTDITRTVAIGDVGERARFAATLVLRGMIAVSVARFPVGLAGRDLDALARVALWSAGLDYDHGTGHGVGAYLSVHEGPQGLSRRAGEVLQAGMILSNEPGYYAEGAFGVRIENLVFVKNAEARGDDGRDMLDFETLSLAPIDKNLIDAGMLTGAELDWLNAYHARVERVIAPLCSPQTQVFLKKACGVLVISD